MKIALDFDKTFTLNPGFWVDFIRTAELVGAEVTIVTARDPVSDGIRWQSLGMNSAPCRIVWCDGLPKKTIVAAKGIKIDVWIDDDPKGIDSGTSVTRDFLLAWREKDIYNARIGPVHGNSRGIDYKELVNIV